MHAELPLRLFAAQDLDDQRGFVFRLRVLQIEDLADRLADACTESRNVAGTKPPKPSAGLTGAV
jgi:hypothetical protein